MGSRDSEKEDFDIVLGELKDSEILSGGDDASTTSDEAVDALLSSNGRFSFSVEGEGT